MSDNEEFTPAPIVRRSQNKIKSGASPTPSKTARHPTSALADDSPSTMARLRRPADVATEQQRHQQQESIIAAPSSSSNQEQNTTKATTTTTSTTGGTSGGGATTSRPLLFDRPPQQQNIAATPGTIIAPKNRRRSRSGSHERAAANQFITPANTAAQRFAQRNLLLGQTNFLRSNNINFGAGVLDDGGMNDDDDDWLHNNNNNNNNNNNQLQPQQSGNNNSNSNNNNNNNTTQDVTQQRQQRATNSDSAAADNFLASDPGPLTITQEQPLHLRDGFQLPSPLPLFTQDNESDARIRASGDNRNNNTTTDNKDRIDQILRRLDDVREELTAAPANDAPSPRSQKECAQEWSETTKNFFQFIDQQPLRIVRP